MHLPEVFVCQQKCPNVVDDERRQELEKGKSLIEDMIHIKVIGNINDKHKFWKERGAQNKYYYLTIDCDHYVNKSIALLPLFSTRL